MLHLAAVTPICKPVARLGVEARCSPAALLNICLHVPCLSILNCFSFLFLCCQHLNLSLSVRAPPISRYTQPSPTMSDTSAAGLEALTGTLLGLSVITVGLRFYARRKTKAPIMADDWLMVGALVRVIIRTENAALIPCIALSYHQFFRFLSSPVRVASSNVSSPSDFPRSPTSAPQANQRSSGPHQSFGLLDVFFHPCGNRGCVCKIGQGWSFHMISYPVK